jgi:hypothetical protein
MFRRTCTKISQSLQGRDLNSHFVQIRALAVFNPYALSLGKKEEKIKIYRIFRTVIIS